MAPTAVYLVTVVVLNLACWTSCAPNNSSVCVDAMKIIKRLADSNKYVKSTRPCENGGPVTVRAGIYIVSINNVKESDMEYDIQIYFRQMWKDPRLSFSHLHNDSLDYFDLSSGYFLDHFWTPDPYFDNEKHGKLHTLLKENHFTRLFANGDIFLSSRLTLTLSCPMEFYDFPMDKQVCTIQFSSYGYITDEIIYKWMTNKTETSVFSNELKLPQFDVLKFEIDSKNESYIIGSYTVLRLKIYFQRRIAYYLIRNYIPAALLVAVSWLSFWIDRQSVPARAGISITTILAMTTLMTGMGGSELPVVSYVKAVDWYYFGCFALVFAGLCEYAIVNKLDVRQRQYVNKMRYDKMISKLHDEEKETTDGVSSGMFTSKFGLDSEEFNDNKTHCEERHDDVFVMHSELSDTIDNIVQILYPLFFILFNVIYWVNYIAIAPDA